MNTSVTLKEIAKATGFGVTTVSRALKNGAELKDSTKELIQSVANQLGYRPNPAGIGLRTGKTGTICLILNRHEEVTGYSLSLISGISEIFRSHGLQLSVNPQFHGDDPLQAVKQIVESRTADGLIFSRTIPNDPRVTYLQNLQIPFVTHGRSASAIPHAFVDFDNYEFARLATARLLSLGHRDLALIAPSPHYQFHDHLRDGFADAIMAFRARYKSNVNHLKISGLTLDRPADELRQEIQKHCLTGKAPTGLVCAGEIASLALVAGYHDCGWLYGENFHLIAKQTSSLFNYSLPALDGLKEDLILTGKLLGQAMVGLLAGESPQAYQTILPPQAIWRYQGEGLKFHKNL